MSDDVETGSVGEIKGMSLNMGSPIEEASVDHQQDDAHLETDEIPAKEEDEGNNDTDTSGDADDNDDDSGDDGEDNGEESEGSDETQLEDLGEYKAEDIEKWDDQYFREDGSMDLDLLSSEYFSNVKEGETEGGLNEGTYGWLEARGITKDDAQRVEKALMAERKAGTDGVASDDLDMITQAGGPEKLQAAIKWGKTSGYNAAEQKRFNTIMNGKDSSAKRDAVDALTARYGRSNAAKPRRPLRDVTKLKGKTVPEVGGSFKNREEYRAAKKAAKGNTAERRLVAEKLHRSKF